MSKSYSGGDTTTDSDWQPTIADELCAMFGVPNCDALINWVREDAVTRSDLVFSMVTWILSKRGAVGYEDNLVC